MLKKVLSLFAIIIAVAVVLAALLALVYERWWIAGGAGILGLLALDYLCLRVSGDGSRKEESQGRIR